MKKNKNLTIEEFLKREKTLKYKLKKFYKYEVKKHIEIYRLIYITFILVLCSSSLLLFDKTKDFGLNLTTEMIGILITVVLIDKLYERKENRKNLKINIRIFNAVNSLICTYISIWKHIKLNFKDDIEINDIDDLIKNYKVLISGLQIESKYDIIQLSAPENVQYNFFIKNDVRESLVKFREYVKLTIPMIINEYNSYIDPDLYDLLKDIENDNLFNYELKGLEDPNQTKAMKLAFSKRIIPKGETEVLEFFLNVNNTSHLYNLKKLINYLNQFYKQLKSFDYEVDSFPYDFSNKFKRFKMSEEN